MKKNILTQLKSEYEELEIKPSDDLWNQIENGLDGNEGTVQKPLLQWWKYAAVVILLISIGGSVYINFDKKPNVNQSIAIKDKSEIINNKTDNSQLINDFKNNIKDPNPKNSEIIFKSEKREIKSTEKVAQTSIDILKEAPLATNISSQLNFESEMDTKIMNKEAEESSKLVLSEKEENKKIKYITANDLIFQRKYSNEKKDGANENVKRLGIIKINKINISTEFITPFDSNTNDQ
ncbi:hypothetical protein [Chryseobacterium echinoideorum]|uniref:hypothetical protein n=1 Tax=Chryseobacterium echinoideorum TaxID=1549648 RepID=UPI001184A79C|nr:hypothetical protein [Chryseobacterium echinoideorum]